MPLIIPKNLPAYDELQQENVFVMHQERAMSQHIRPLRILILNLMPTKIVTETQLARLLANSPLQLKTAVTPWPEPADRPRRAWAPRNHAGGRAAGAPGGRS